MFHQFLSPWSNQRSDRYGGDVEGRTRIVAELGDPTCAAIASPAAAKRYGLEILESDISDHPDNMTRFIALGREPLPDGAVRAFRSATDDRLFAYVGATSVKYIPIDERVELDLGPDPEVLVKPVLMNWEKTNLNFDQNGDIKGWTTKATWEIEVQNSRDIDVMLDIRRNFSGDWSLATTAPYEKVDANKVKFLLPLKPREKQKFTYELTTRLGTNATR